jgi:hypothetical protein
MTNIVKFPSPPQIEPSSQEWSHGPVWGNSHFNSLANDDDIPSVMSDIVVRAVHDGTTDTDCVEILIRDFIPPGKKPKRARATKVRMSEQQFLIMCSYAGSALKRLNLHKRLPLGEG